MANIKFSFSNHFIMHTTETWKSKVHDNIPWYQVCLSVSKDFTKYEISRISLNVTIYDFSVDHSAIEKEGILHIQEYLMKKINLE